MLPCSLREEDVLLPQSPVLHNRTVSFHLVIIVMVMVRVQMRRMVMVVVGMMTVGDLLLE